MAVERARIQKFGANLGSIVSPCRKGEKERGKEARKEDRTGGEGGGGNPSNSAL